MISTLILNPVFPAWAILLATISAFLFFTWKEVQRGSRFLTLRIISLLAVFTAILGISLRPAVVTESNNSGSVLLTSRYRPASIDSLLKEYPSLKVYSMKDAATFAGAETLKDEGQLEDIGNSLRFIAGEGLSADLLELISGKNLGYVVGEIPDGVTKLTVDKNITVNKPSGINGIYHTQSGDEIKLKLKGPSGTVDSVTLKGPGSLPFTFLFRPQQSGLFVYSVEAADTNVLKERLPVEVLTERKLNILFLQKFPTAETRHLKNFLAENGHAVSLRYQTSKTNFNYEYVNTPSVRIDRLTPELCQSMDLIFVDNEVLNGISASEKINLNDAITNGLGLILLDLPDKPGVHPFAGIKTTANSSDTLHFVINRLEYVLPIQPLVITAEPGIDVIMMRGEKIISGSKFYGAGKVGFQLLKETYRIRLEGNTENYSQLWTPLIDKVARTRKQNFELYIDNTFPIYSDDAVKFNIISSGDKPHVYDQNVRLPLQEDVLIDDLWLGKSWTRKSGWNTLSIKSDSTNINYFVFNKNDWQSLRSTNYTKATRLVQSSERIDHSVVKTVETIAIPLLWFYLLFLLGALFLWLAPKL